MHTYPKLHLHTGLRAEDYQTILIIYDATQRKPLVYYCRSNGIFIQFEVDNLLLFDQLGLISLKMLKRKISDENCQAVPPLLVVTIIYIIKTE